MKFLQTVPFQKLKQTWNRISIWLIILILLFIQLVVLQTPNISQSKCDFAEVYTSNMESSQQMVYQIIEEFIGGH